MWMYIFVIHIVINAIKKKCSKMILKNMEISQFVDHICCKYGVFVNKISKI